MTTAEYFREYNKKRYAQQKEENEIYMFIRHMFHENDRSAEYAKRTEQRRRDPDLILKSVHLVLADPEIRRLERVYAGQKFRAVHRYDKYYDSDYVADIRRLFK